MALLNSFVVVVKDIGICTPVIGLECSAELSRVLHLLVHFRRCHPWQQKIGAWSHELMRPSVLHLMHHGGEVRGADWRLVLVNDGAERQSIACGQVVLARGVD